MNNFRRTAFCLQKPGGRLEQPGEQQNQKQPEIVPAQTSGHRLRIGNSESWQPKILAELAHPMGRLKEIAGRENPTIVVSFNQANSAAIDVKESITTRLDEQQQ